MSDLPYPNEPDRTHWNGCYRSAKHHNCAVAEIDRLYADNASLRARLAEVEGERDKLLNAGNNMHRAINHYLTIMASPKPSADVQTDAWNGMQRSTYYWVKDCAALEGHT